MSKATLHDGLYLLRKLTSAEAEDLQERLRPVFSLPDEGDGVTTNDLIEYAVAMVGNSNTIRYVVEKLVEMELDFCNQETAERIGSKVRDFFIECLGADAVGGLNSHDVGTVALSTTQDTPTKARIAILKSKDVTNALSVLGELGSTRERGKRTTGGVGSKRPQPEIVASTASTGSLKAFKGSPSGNHTEGTIGSRNSSSLKYDSQNKNDLDIRNRLDVRGRAFNRLTSQSDKETSSRRKGVDPGSLNHREIHGGRVFDNRKDRLSSNDVNNRGRHTAGRHERDLNRSAGINRNKRVENKGWDSEFRSSEHHGSSTYHEENRGASGGRTIGHGRSSRGGRDGGRYGQKSGIRRKRESVDNNNLSGREDENAGPLSKIGRSGDTLRRTVHLGDGDRLDRHLARDSHRLHVRGVGASERDGKQKTSEQSPSKLTTIDDHSRTNTVDAPHTNAAQSYEDKVNQDISNDRDIDSLTRAGKDDEYGHRNGTENWRGSKLSFRGRGSRSGRGFGGRSYSWHAKSDHRSFSDAEHQSLFGEEQVTSTQQDTDAISSISHPSPIVSAHGHNGTSLFSSGRGRGRGRGFFHAHNVKTILASNSWVRSQEVKTDRGEHG